MFLIKFYKKLPVFLYDGLAIPFAWYMAYWLRFNLKPLPTTLFSHDAKLSFLLLFITQVGCYCYCKIYRGLWQFASMNDLVRIFQSVFYTLMIIIPAFYLTTTIQHLPRSVLPLYAIIYCATLSLGRITRRLHWDQFKSKKEKDGLTRVLIIGAGRAGEGLIRDLHRTSDYVPIAIIDDQIGKQGLEIHGVRVMGRFADIPTLVKKLKAELIFIAIPSAGSSIMRRIVEQCESAHIPFRTLPGLSDLMDGRVEVKALREVSLEDLLGRDEIHLDWDKIRADILGKCVLVTGGGGSIGSELCRQILQLHPAKLILIDHAEYHLYQMEQELKVQSSTTELAFVLASTTDQQEMQYWFSQFKPDVVFHAAAYKHVPLLESRIRAAVWNNVIGTQVVAQASVDAGVYKFILISSDKAVNPSNVMGATKRIAELYCQNLNDRVKTQFITVRFGNVLGSTGSVVPLFRKQLQEGGPLTVTHPEIERFFMTIPEACQLILQSTVNGSGGEIFVLDMGDPVKIRYLAEQMIRFSGRDIEIVYTGLRPGEKLYEELFHADEPLIQTEHDKLFKASFRPRSWEELAQTMQLLTYACEAHDESELQFLLKSLVPELQPVCVEDVHQLAQSTPSPAPENREEN
ncbi:MAG: nucleoside-diphosphate sugar epimerase/dehydratase [Gammaproteobacteria bacterium]|nr:nucleoside-diphosphate sugar epimerase/dehydratase [Gammaproteobacteria bacterium]